MTSTRWPRRNAPTSLVSSWIGSRPNRSSISTSRICDSAVLPCWRSESPGSVLTPTFASAQKLAISRTTLPGTLGSAMTTISTRRSVMTRGRSTIVPSTRTPSTMLPVRRASSSMNPIGASRSPDASPRRISWMRCTPVWSAPTTSVRTERSGSGPSTRSRDSRHAKRRPPSNTSSSSQTTMMMLRGNGDTGVNSEISAMEAADSVTPLNTWNSVTVLA